MMLAARMKWSKMPVYDVDGTRQWHRLKLDWLGLCGDPTCGGRLASLSFTPLDGSDKFDCSTDSHWQVSLNPGLIRVRGESERWIYSKHALNNPRRAPRRPYQPMINAQRPLDPSSQLASTVVPLQGRSPGHSPQPTPSSGRASSKKRGAFARIGQRTYGGLIEEVIIWESPDKHAPRTLMDEISFPRTTQGCAVSDEREVIVAFPLIVQCPRCLRESMIERPPAPYH